MEKHKISYTDKYSNQPWKVEIHLKFDRNVNLRIILLQKESSYLRYVSYNYLWDNAMTNNIVTNDH